MLFCLPAACAAQWTVLVFIQADGSLKESVIRALEDLAIHKNMHASVKLLVEVFWQDQRERFICDHQGMHMITHDRFAYDSYKALIQSCIWAFDTHSSPQTALIISGHGSGIVDPSWDKHRLRWVYDSDEGDSYYFDYLRRQNELFLQQVAALEIATQQVTSQQGVEPQPAMQEVVMRRPALQHVATPEVGPQYIAACDHKGLFLESCHGSLTCTQLAAVLKHVNDAILKRKLDILGFDACNMAVLDVAYACSPYAQIMVASQDCEEKDGWNYRGIADLFMQDRVSNARALVFAYEKSQRQKQHELFSLSALDLNMMSPLVGALDEVCYHVTACLQKYTSDFHNLLCSARQNNHRFCRMPMYADLQVFLSNLFEETYALDESEELMLLRNALLNALEKLQTFIIAHAAGKACSQTRGCSVYFPYAHSDTSYSKSKFAQDTRWGLFLRNWFSKTSYEFIPTAQIKG